jgi:hypothetical protein
MSTTSNSAPSMNAMPPPGNVVFSDSLIEKMITSCLDNTVDLTDDHQIRCRVGSQVVKFPISLFPIAPSTSVQSVPLEIVGDESGEMKVPDAVIENFMSLFKFLQGLDATNTGHTILGSYFGSQSYVLVDFHRELSKFSKFFSLLASNTLHWRIVHTLDLKGLLGPSGRQWRSLLPRSQRYGWHDHGQSDRKIIAKELQFFERVRYRSFTALVNLLRNGPVVNMDSMRSALTPLSNLLASQDDNWQRAIMGKLRAPESAYGTTGIFSIENRREVDLVMDLNCNLGGSILNGLASGLELQLNAALPNRFQSHHASRAILDPKIRAAFRDLHKIINSVENSKIEFSAEHQRTLLEIFDSHPLFVLLRSGILGAFNDRGSVGFGLTIPMLASGLAKRSLGCLPYTFIGDSRETAEGDESKDDEGLIAQAPVDSDDNICDVGEAGVYRLVHKLWDYGDE